MPLAVALLCHPLGSYTALLTGVVAALYAAQSRRFLPTFTAASAGLLAILAYLQVQPSLPGLVCLAAGVVLLHVEFLRPTFGSAGLLGTAAASYGSYLGLASLGAVVASAIAVLGAVILLAAVARTMRLWTLPP
jgi:hypothetical protein